MFEQSLMQVSRETRRRKGMAAMCSYAAEGAAVLVLLAMPIVHTDALPMEEHPTVHAPTRYVPEHVQVIAAEPSRPRTRVAAFHPLMQPTQIPHSIDMRPDPHPPQIADAGPETPCPGCIPAGPGEEGGRNAVIDSVLRANVVAPVHRASAPVVRPSHSQESLLLRQVKPVYPRLAIQTRTQGPVVLQAIIARDGTIQHLQVMSGHPLLVKAAVDAVLQWRYRPYVLDGEPVEVETQITVNFTLGGN